jgi:hypothetical protein
MKTYIINDSHCKTMSNYVNSLLIISHELLHNLKKILYLARIAPTSVLVDNGNENLTNEFT